MYTCYKQPRHLSVSIDKFHYTLPYDYLVGGVFAIRTEQYRQVNGYSNSYWGWGGEDDDLDVRIRYAKLTIQRPPARIARYKMMRHKQQKLNEQTTFKLRENFTKLKQDYESDISDLRKKLDTENRKRELVQDEQDKLEQQVLDTTKENVEMKKVNFDSTFRFQLMQNQQKQAERRVKLLQEKKRLLVKELDSNKTTIDRDAAKINSDIERVKMDEKQAQIEEQRLENDFKKLQVFNN